MFADSCSWSLVASLSASSSALRSATVAVAPTITSTSAMNGAKMNIRIGRPSCTGTGHRRRSPRPDSQIHPLLPIARSLTCPGISAQNHPNRLARGSATRKATGARIHVTVNVKNSADEMFRYEMADVNSAEQMKPHITGSNSMISTTNTAYRAPRLRPAEIRVPADELIGHPHEGRPEEVALRPAQDEAWRHSFDQIREHVRRRDGDQRGIAEEHDAQEDDQVLQRLERLCTRHQHDERSDVPLAMIRTNVSGMPRNAFASHRLPLPAESPPLADSEGEAAEGADGQHQADEIAESAPHLQQREGDGADDASSQLMTAVMRISEALAPWCWTRSAGKPVDMVCDRLQVLWGRGR